MAFGRISNNFQQLKENVKALAHSSAEYYKLELFNKSIHGAIAAIKGVAIALFMFFFIMFISIAVAVALSNWIDSPSSGFFIVAGIYLLLVLFFVFFGSKVLMKAILPGASRKFFQKPEKKPVHEEHHEFTPQKDFETDEIIIKDNERV
ncbi:phage holin family protein [Salinimicrobium sp. HB62]|uniref:phage holin family protein n=1 Tax=Salinimicrobium sp. HB62 TaxID=3077781 RepID=UPI002D796740|nr:phage holin family protein [Salinimicrobium sp. HB62]